MTFDKERVKERVSIRYLLERDGHKLKRAGSALVCRCPVHDEKTSSCHVHENEGFFKCFGCDFKGDIFKYWERTRGCDFKTALEQLAAIAGVSAEVGMGSAECGMKPIAPKPEPVEVLAPKLGDGRDEAWLNACSLLMMDVEAQQRIAEWRGFSEETIRWAAESRLMGLVVFMGAKREAFLVERPAGENDEIQITKSETLVPIGWHVRLAPNSPGNEHPKKASWRYPWAGIGSWPFVMGDVATAKILFFMEGQWDGLALVDLMGWNGGETGKRKAETGKEGVPKGVAIVCMRGATSWKLFLKHYSWPDKATGFTIADADNAGRTWFEKDGFVEQLQSRLKRVIGFFPANANAFKDFNDVHKAKAITRGQMSAILRGKMRKNLDKKRGVTFLKWCREQAGARADLIGKAAFLVVRDQKRPRGWKPFKVWERHWAKVMATEDIPHLKAAWGEWRKE